MASTPWYDYRTTQAHGVNGERGIDIGTPMNTPLTALYGGTVISSGYKPWGGEVDILANVPGLGPVIEYFIHLNDIGANMVKGATVKAGQVIGLSGGQTSGGDHPTSSQYSTGAHTEFGLVAANVNGNPWIGTAYDPTAAINAARSGTLSTTTSTGNNSIPVLSGIGDAAGTVAGAVAGAALSPADSVLGIIGGAFNGVTDIPGAIKGATQSVFSGVVALAERIGIFLLALMAIGFGILLIIWAPASDAVKKAANVAAVVG